MAKPIIVESEGEEKKHEAQSVSEAAQEKLLIYQILRQQLENMQSQAALLENAFMEAENSKQCLRDLAGTEKETLIPLGSGCYAHGKIANRGSLVVNIGAGVMAEKDTASALQMLEQKKTEIEKQFNELQKNVQLLVAEMNKIAGDLESIK